MRSIVGTRPDWFANHHDQLHHVVEACPQLSGDQPKRINEPHKVDCIARWRQHLDSSSMLDMRPD